jgi:hypothetical protein
MSLKKYDSNIKNLLQLSGLKESFKTYADIITDDFRTKQRAVSRISNKINSGKFLDSVISTLKFWLDDVSPKFEKQISILKSQ